MEEPTGGDALAAPDPYDVMAYYYDLFARADAAGHQTSPNADAFAGPARAGDVVLDFGSGTGTLALRLAELGCTVHCFEPSRGMRAVHLAKLSARPELAARTVLLPAGATGLPSGVDYALCAGVLQCLDGPDRRKLFAGLAGAVRPGGLLALDMLTDGRPSTWELRTAAETTVAGVEYRLRTSSEALTDSTMRRRAEYTASLDGRIVHQETVSRVLFTVPRPAVHRELAEAGFALLDPPPGVPEDFALARRSGGPGAVDRPPTGAAR
ncbi:class I SAM-dependent methyltransferase [Kitasatospora sp. NPDC098652]|uniref:class I SAM-dependent methyltransferase n=1 Tax=Kitasatospora sp. NPDC098652 TaxID=3364095 RepID=UPI003800E560